MVDPGARSRGHDESAVPRNLFRVAPAADFFNVISSDKPKEFRFRIFLFHDFESEVSVGDSLAFDLDIGCGHESNTRYSGLHEG